MWGKVAMVPLLRQTIRFLLDDGPMAVRRCPYGKRKRERRTRSAFFATLPFDRGPNVPD
jgi:hypothetical protein